MELLDIVDEQGLPTGKTVDRKIAHAQGICHRTAHIWIARQVNGRWQVLLQKRAMTKDSFPGCYDTSSAGHIQAGDEPKDSARRELAEELGITAEPEQLQFVGNFRIRYQSQFHGSVFKDNEIAFVYVYSEPVDIGDLTLQKEELDGVKWFDLEKLQELRRKNDPTICVPTPGLNLISSVLKGTGNF